MPTKPATALLLLAATAISACGSNSGGKTADIPAGAPGSTSTSTTPAAAPKPTATAKGCKPVSKPAPKPNGGAKKPKGTLDGSKTWTLTFTTNCGAFTVKLDLKSAPHASASMVSLARSGFFKNTIFHRIVPGFVIQGGDPTGQGTGGPGYSTHDKVPKNAGYTRGVVAMAKTQSEPPGTAGSQFYVVTGADAGLPPDYAIIGKVSKGLATVARIGRLGDSSEKPTQTVELYGVTVKSF
jgi:cyclophilin family peptidyl-prolyl cis-trans isomerase